MRHYTNLSTLNHNVRFLPCQHRGVGIMQYVYALNPVVHPVLIIPGHSREVPRQGWTSVEIREYNGDSVAHSAGNDINNIGTTHCWVV